VLSIVIVGMGASLGREGAPQLTGAAVATALGVEPTEVSTPTWVDHVYSCQYVYPSGVMPVSVKELSSRAETSASLVQSVRRR